MPHPTPQQLADFGRGKLPERDMASVAVHLASCPACRKAVNAVPPDSFLDKVRAAGRGDASFPPGLAQPHNAPTSAGRPLTPAVPCPDLPSELARHPKYLILRELGRGGMGVVYQARHKEMDRQIVIKVINRSLLDRPDSLERFRREIRAAAQLSHPNIVTAYDAEQAGELHMLVMEFVPGQSFAEVVQKKGLLPVAHACLFARQVALGLQHAHERGMVHRDIKPQNLMLTLKNQVKILDFGLAKVFREGITDTSTRLTSLNVYLGTPEYCAPEQALDARTADIRADLYSLGCTLYYLLSGRPPFREDTIVNTILAHQQKQPQPLPELRPEVPAELWQVIKRLLAKDPAQRYQKPIEVVQALAPFVKPGSKSDAKAAPAPAVVGGSPVKGTMISADTNEIRNVLREVPGKTPPKGVPAKEEKVLREVPGKTAPKPVPAKEGKTSPFTDLGVSASPAVTQGSKRKGRKGCVLTAAVGASLALMLMLIASGRIPFRPHLDSLFRSSPEPKPAELPTKPDPAENKGNAQAPDPMEEWLREVAALPAEQQIERVKDKLKELNPGFKGWSDPPTIKDGVVIGLVFVTDHVTDITPLRVLRGLKKLTCVGSNDGKGKLADLSPLKGMQLTCLICYRNSPLTDLSPLKGMPLECLECWGTAIRDLSPLKGMPLKSLVCASTSVSDLSPLKNLPLKTLNCDFRPERDTAILRSITTLERINNEPVAQFWKELNLPTDASVDRLRQALKNKDPDVRKQAATLLAERGSEAEPALNDLAETLTSEKKPEVRIAAASAIAKIAAKIGHKAKAVVPALIKGLQRDQPFEIRKNASEALGHIKYPANKEAVTVILDAIKNDEDARVRADCVIALAAMQKSDFKKSKADKLLTKVLDERDKKMDFVRYNAACKLASTLQNEAPDKTVDILLQLLKDKDAKVVNGGDARHLAAQALGWLGKKASRRTDVADALKAAKKDVNDRLRKEATAALEKLGIP